MTVTDSFHQVNLSSPRHMGETSSSSESLKSTEFGGFRNFAQPAFGARAGGAGCSTSSVPPEDIHPFSSTVLDNQVAIRRDVPLSLLSEAFGVSRQEVPRNILEALDGDHDCECSSDALQHIWSRGAGWLVADDHLILAAGGEAPPSSALQSTASPCRGPKLLVPGAGGLRSPVIATAAIHVVSMSPPHHHKAARLLSAEDLRPTVRPRSSSVGPMCGGAGYGTWQHLEQELMVARGVQSEVDGLRDNRELMRIRGIPA